MYFAWLTKRMCWHLQGPTTLITPCSTSAFGRVLFDASQTRDPSRRPFRSIQWSLASGSDTALMGMIDAVNAKPDTAGCVITHLWHMLWFILLLLGVTGDKQQPASQQQNGLPCDGYVTALHCQNKSALNIATTKLLLADQISIVSHALNNTLVYCAGTSSPQHCL